MLYLAYNTVSNQPANFCILPEQVSGERGGIPLARFIPACSKMFWKKVNTWGIVLAVRE